MTRIILPSESSFEHLLATATIDGWIASGNAISLTPNEAAERNAHITTMGSNCRYLPLATLERMAR